MGERLATRLSHSVRCAKTQIVQACELVVCVHLGDDGFEFCSIPQQYGTKVKIVAECTYLVVDHGRLINFPFSIFHFQFIEMVGIDHRGTGHLHDLYHSFLAQIDPFNLGFETDHGVGR